MLAPMATWLDGPEYAPTARPCEFTAPRVPPLEPAPQRTRPSAGAPADQPTYSVPDQRPLEQVGVKPPAGRDPHTAFAVAHNEMTAGVDPVTGAHDPRQPLTAATVVDHGRQASAWAAARSGHQGIAHSMPPSGLAFAPPTGPPASARPGVFASAHPAVLAALIIGGLAIWISPIALVAALGFSRRVRHARTTVQLILGGAVAVVVTWFLVSLLLNGLMVVPAWTATRGLALVLCWIALILVVAIVARSVGRGEAPSPPPEP